MTLDEVWFNRTMGRVARDGAFLGNLRADEVVRAFGPDVPLDVAVESLPEILEDEQEARVLLEHYLPVGGNLYDLTQVEQDMLLSAYEEGYENAFLSIIETAVLAEEGVMH